MRILIVTHAPLTSEFGASQLAINLSEALRAQGHDVTLWSPRPVSAKIRWWRTIPTMRSGLREFLRSQEPFDVVDCPPTLVAKLESGTASIVARSTQPDLLYLWSGLRGRRIRSIKELVRVPFEWLHTIYHMILVLRGWKQANKIMCLGSVELQWMRRWFPWWRSKLVSYSVSPSNADRTALAEVRTRRKPRTNESLQFLWIGRWTQHKGTDLLLHFMKQWVHERPQDSFTIAGCGSEAEKDCPPELLSSGAVKIMPAFERAKLYTLLAEHDIGLFTSHVEGWGLSLQEMLESGMPVYATRAGAVDDLRPFFDTLLPFPPSHQVAVPPTKEISAGYYRAFAWSEVAQAYSDSAPDIGRELAASSV